MKNIATSLVKAQKEFGPALKTATNPHFRSKYADLASCVEAVMDALNNNGIYLLQKTHDQQNGIMVETVFVHESGEMLNCGNLYFPASKNDAQGFMSALTYARRGSLMAACGIAPEDDDGNAASRKPTQAFNLQAAQTDVAAAKTVDELGKVWATHGAIATAAKDRDGYASLKALCADRKAALEAA
jgi:hypothetical protein